MPGSRPAPSLCSQLHLELAAGVLRAGLLAPWWSGQTRGALNHCCLPRGCCPAAYPEASTCAGGARCRHARRWWPRCWFLGLPSLAGTTRGFFCSPWPIDRISVSGLSPSQEKSCLASAPCAWTCASLYQVRCAARPRAGPGWAVIDSEH